MSDCMKLLADARKCLFEAGSSREWIKSAVNLSFRIDALLASGEQYVMVPREPTMGQWDDFCSVHKVEFETFISAYKAMIAAAPLPQGDKK